MKIDIQTIVASIPLIVIVCSLLISEYDAIRGTVTFDKKRAIRGCIACTIHILLFVLILWIYGLEN